MSLKLCSQCGKLCLGAFTLPCAHLSCRQCLHHLLQQHGSRPTCLSCARHLRLPKGQGSSVSLLVKQLGTDPTTDQLVHQQLLSQGRQACLVHDNSEATMVCEDCRDHFCDGCSEVHRKQGSTKDHVLQLLPTALRNASTASYVAPTPRTYSASSTDSSDVISNPGDPPPQSQDASRGQKQWKEWLQKEVRLLQQAASEQRTVVSTVRDIMSLGQQVLSMAEQQELLLQTYTACLSRCHVTQQIDSNIYVIRRSRDGVMVTVNTEHLRRRLCDIRTTRHTVSGPAVERVRAQLSDLLRGHADHQDRTTAQIPSTHSGSSAMTSSQTHITFLTHIPTVPSTYKPTVPRTETLTVSLTNIHTVSYTKTPTVSLTKTHISPNVSPTNTPTAPLTNTSFVSVTNTPTVSLTNTPTVSLTNTPTVSLTNTHTVSPTNTPTVSLTNTPTVSLTDTPTVSPTNTSTVSPTNTPTVSLTNTPTVSPTNTPTVFLTNTPTVSLTNTPTVSPTNTPTVFLTNTPNVSLTNTPTVSLTNTPTVSLTNTPTVSLTNTPTVSLTNTPTVSLTDTRTVSLTNTPTVSLTNTPTVSLTNTSTVSLTNTPTVSLTNTHTGSVSNNSTVSPTNTADPSIFPPQSQTPDADTMMATPHKVFVATPTSADDKKKAFIIAIICTQDEKLIMVDSPNKKIKMVEMSDPHTVSASLTLLEHPQRLALLSDGLVAVTTREPTICLLKVTPTPTLTVTSRIHTGRRYLGVADGVTDHTLLVSCGKTNRHPARVDVITRSGDVVRTVVTSNTMTELISPAYLCGRDGFAWVSDWGRDTVYKVDVGTGQLVDTVTQTDMQQPAQVCVDKETNIFIADWLGQCVLVRSVQGQCRRLVFSPDHTDQGCDRPWGACVTGSGRLVVAWRSPRSHSLVIGYDMK